MASKGELTETSTASASAGPIITATETNPRGIPKTTFIDNIDEFMASTKHEVEDLIGRYSENLKYQLMESRLAQARATIRSKIPETERDLEAVRMLATYKDSPEAVNTRYELADGLFAYAKIQQPKNVVLAIGASVLVEHSFEEAQKIFETSLSQLRTRLNEFDEDMDFVSEQITTTQVLMSRFYNYDVKQRKLKKDKQAQ